MRRFSPNRTRRRAVAIGRAFVIAFSVLPAVHVTAVRNAHAQGTETVPRRPVPAPVEAPARLMRAIDLDWRSPDGAPGEDYWQQGGSYELMARLHPDESRLEGRVRILYASNAPGRFPSVWLHLHQNLHAEGAPRREAVEITGGINVRSLAVDGELVTEYGDDAEGGPPGYRIEGTLMEVHPEVPLERGDTLEIEIDFDFIVPQNGAGRMGHSEREVYFIAYWFPKMAVLDDLRAWNADPYLATAEFYDGFANYSAEISVPQGWTVMATGELENPQEVFSALTLERLAEARSSEERVMIAGQGERAANAVTAKSGDGWLTYRYSAAQARDFAWTASNVQRWDATSAVVGDRDGDGVDDRTLIHSFWRPERAPLWEDQWLYAKQSVEHHSVHTGFPYPWPHMTSVEGSDIIDGGMEFPMMTVMGSYEGREPQDLFNVTSHEIGHMWIPMIVGTNEKRYAWMDQGMTTYLEGESRMEYWPGIDHHRVEARSYLQAAAFGIEEPMMRHGDAYESIRGYGIASYSKPATLFVALRDIVGRETWEEAYRAFISEWAYRHPTPWDFFNTVERFAEQDLDWFWTSFFFETWKLDHAVGEVRGRTGGGVSVTIEDRGFAPFPASVRVRTASGGTLEFDVPVEHWLDGNRHYIIEVPASAGPVTRVEIDPSGYAPDADRANNIWPSG